MNHVPWERLPEIFAHLERALEELDQAVGQAARLRVEEREWIRQTIVPPRTYLKRSVESLRRLHGEAERSGEERRSR